MLSAWSRSREAVRPTTLWSMPPSTSPSTCRQRLGAGLSDAAGEFLHRFEPLPQLLKNVRFAGGKPLAADSVKAVIADAEAELAGKGRLVIRPSGTEPVIRVMAE
eukprot:gene15317-20300_t